MEIELQEVGANVAEAPPNLDKESPPLPNQVMTEVTTKTQNKMSVFGNPDCLHNPGMAWLSTTRPHYSFYHWRSMCTWNHPLWWLLFLSTIPPAFVALVYGVIPVGPPSPPEVSDKLVYLLVF